MNVMIVSYDCLGGLIILLVIGVTLWSLHCMNEMQLRRKRIRYRDELPLDRSGVPLYLPAGAQPMPRSRRLPAARRPTLLVEASSYDDPSARYDDLDDEEEGDR